MNQLDTDTKDLKKILTLLILILTNTNSLSRFFYSINYSFKKMNKNPFLNIDDLTYFKWIYFFNFVTGVKKYIVRM